MRFSLPQNPLEDGDPGYLWPALMKLSGGTFTHIQGLNFLYPGMVYLILRICADFRAISVVQHILGLTAGALFLASWNRLGDFFPKARLNRIAHEAIGLWGAAIYLLSNTPILFEMLIRSDAICMFFRSLGFLATNSILLLPHSFAERTEGSDLLWRCSRCKRFRACFVEAEFHAHGGLCRCVGDVVNS